MHTVEMLERLLALAGQMGYVIRQEWLGGSGGGECQFGGRRYIFVDSEQYRCKHFRNNIRHTR